MAQLTYVGQGQHAACGPLAASAMLLLSLVFALLGIKIWGFRRRLTFDRGGQSASTRSSQQSQSAPRYASYESQVTGTDNAVHGVFRQRNTEEFESARPTNTTANKYFTGSVPNLQLSTLAPYAYREETGIPEMAGTAPYRPDPQAARRRRGEVHSDSYDYYTTPPTRQPPAPPIPMQPAAAAGESTSQLDMPAFDHFAEKYELISAKTAGEEARESQLMGEERGRYLKYEQVDDVPELLTPDDDQVGAAISVAAVVHHVPITSHQKSEPALELDPEPEPEAACSSRRLELEHTDSAFVVEIIAGTPDSIELKNPVLARNLFDDLELPQHLDDAQFQRIRSTYEMNEAELLDMQPDFAALPMELPVPSSPPGFGKSIDDDWENFENLDNVAEVPEPNWLVHPAVLESPQQETSRNLGLENVMEPEPFFQQLELMETSDNDLRPQRATDYVQPPPYEMKPPALPILPDYESLMQQESSQPNQNLPNYADVASQRMGNGANYVSSIEDLFGELQENGVAAIDNSTPLAKQVHNFEELCEGLEIVASPVPARRPPQPAPRVSKPTTLNARGDAPPLACYEPEELSSSSSSDEEAKEVATPAPQPAKRLGRTLKVRFDVDNLQYYQSAEVPSSNESEVDFESEDEDEHIAQLPPRATQRLIPLLPEELLSNTDEDMPRLFSTQVSQEDSDDEAFGRAIRQHRSMTEALRPVVQLERTTPSDRSTEA